MSLISLNKNSARSTSSSGNHSLSTSIHSSTSLTLRASKVTTSQAFPQWREKVGLVIASNLQRMYRGWKVRQMLLFERWIEMNHAASIIQKAFRANRQKMENKYFTDAYLFAKEKKKLLAEFKLKQASNYNSKIERIFNNECTFEENMSFWRSIIELRRGYPRYTTDVLIKALIENKNDVLGSIKTLGNIQFSMRNESNLSTENRLRFLPETIKVDTNILFQSPVFQTTSNRKSFSRAGTSTVKQRIQSSPYGRTGPVSRSSTANSRSYLGTASSAVGGLGNTNNFESLYDELQKSKSNFQLDVLRILLSAYFSTKQKIPEKKLKA